MSKLFNYKYPKLRSYVKLYRSKKSGEYFFVNYVDEDKCWLTDDEYEIARHLDGKTDPFAIHPEWDRQYVKEILIRLKRDYDLTTKTRITHGGRLETFITLFDIGNKKKSARLFCLLRTYLQILLFLPITLIGIYNLFHMEEHDYSLLWCFLGTAFFSLLGLCYHEYGHAASGIAFGAKVFEAGIILGIPFGAYVMMGNEKEFVKGRFERMQILAAGVENNLILAGVLSIICGQVGSTWLFNFLYAGAIQNLAIGALNLLLIKGLDGCRIIQEFLGIDDDILPEADEVILDSEEIIYALGLMKTNRDKIKSVCVVGFLGAVPIALIAVMVLLTLQ